MSSGDLTIISIHFCDLLATCMTRCAFNCTFYGDYEIAVAICLHVLDRHLRDVEGNLKGLTHCLTLFPTFSDRYMWTQLIDITTILHSGKSQRTVMIIDPLGDAFLASRSCTRSVRLIPQPDKPGTMLSLQHVYEGVVPWSLICFSTSS